MLGDSSDVHVLRQVEMQRLPAEMIFSRFCSDSSLCCIHRLFFYTLRMYFSKLVLVEIQHYSKLERAKYNFKSAFKKVRGKFEHH